MPVPANHQCIQEARIRALEEDRGDVARELSELKTRLGHAGDEVTKTPSSGLTAIALKHQEKLDEIASKLGVLEPQVDELECKTDIQNRAALVARAHKAEQELQQWKTRAIRIVIAALSGGGIVAILKELLQ